MEGKASIASFQSLVEYCEQAKYVLHNVQKKNSCDLPVFNLEPLPWGHKGSGQG